MYKKYFFNFGLFISIIVSSIALGYLLSLFGVACSLALYFFMIIICFAMIKSLNGKKLMLRVAVICYIFSFMTLIGLMLEAKMNLSYKRLGVVALGSVLLGVVIYFTISFLIELKSTGEKRKVIAFESLPDNIFIIGVYLIIVLSWIPTLLAFFPGLFSADVPDQAVQTMGTYSTHHPLIHTLFLQMCLRIGRTIWNTNFGIFIYELVQMSLMAFIMSLAISYVRRKGASLYFIIGMILLYGIYPVSATLAITTTKDSLFSAFFLAFILLLVELIDYEEHFFSKRKQICLVLSAVLCMLFRNNAVYVVPFAFIFLFICVPHYKKNVFKLGVATVLLFIVASMTLKVTTSAVDDETKREMLSVPCQQLARVFVLERENLDDSEKDDILKYVPDAEKYNEFIADNTKDTENIDGDIDGFLRLYITLLRKYPMRYLEAFLLNIKGYYDLNDTSCNSITKGVDTIGYLWLYFWEYEGAEHIHLLPRLENWYYEWFCLNKIEDIPVVNTLFRFGIFTWAILFSHAYIEGADKKKYAPVFWTVELLLLSYLFGPCSYPRYAFPFIIVSPVIIIMSLSSNKQ